MMRYKLKLGDCLEIMPTVKENGADAIICDPPYGLTSGPTKYLGEGGRGGFMGRAWDHGVPGVPFWKEALRIAKPGAHLLAFGGTRTHHRLMCAIEDAGWELRDCLMWVYGSGMPKGHDISKAIDRMAGAKRDVIGFDPTCRLAINRNMNDDGWGKIGQQGAPITAPATEAAKQWDGWNTNLKPSFEPIILARKPISEKTIAANVLKWGCGGINVDGCRINTMPGDELTPRNNKVGQNGWKNSSGGYIEPSPLGRWPANLILDEEAGALLDEMSGTLKSGTGAIKRATSAGSQGNAYGVENRPAGTAMVEYGDVGGASRFFYTAKASKSDRGDGNDWPTVKPTSLMRYLCKLITPPNGVIVDPFMGSGSTGKAALLEGFLFYGIDSDEHAFEIASRRIKEVSENLEKV